MSSTQSMINKEIKSTSHQYPSSRHGNWGEMKKTNEHTLDDSTIDVPKTTSM